ncbi:hypothetical protein [Paraburkholderia bannensis]|uniref:hypothetical protein n=1 Tax=Paraburkholderia bannensis TaxID=765414 RepID=UPI002AB0C313|nr:hypothetical protein [Paraburkholderia bannensis]
MRAEASKRKINFRHIALDGQDRHVLADYILTNESTFMLVEFKYTLSQLPSERKKDRAAILCEQLVLNNRMRKRHDLCHFIAWMSLTDRCPSVNIYRKEICNRQILGCKWKLEDDFPTEKARESAVVFARSFFEEPATKTLPINEFEIYVEWLCSLGERNASGLELLVIDESSGNCDFMEFESVRKLYDWFQSQRPPAPPPPAPSYGPGW